jgi:hypothetical protein
LKPPSLRVVPVHLDEELDAPVAAVAPRRPIVARLIGVLGPIGLALFLSAAYACGLSLYTDVSPLETRAIHVQTGFFALMLITVWPTFGDQESGGNHRPRAARKCAAISEASRDRS